MSKPVQHHWWPRAIVDHWTNESGFVHRLEPDETEIPLQPTKAARIGHAHSIKLGKEGEPTPWDTSYEHDFQNADDNFPAVVQRLKDVAALTEKLPLNDRFVPQNLSGAERETLVECVVSLAVRSPAFREKCASIAERFRGPLPERERNAIIGLNQRNCHQSYSKSFQLRCKIAILVSEFHEFIYGDGIYSTLVPSAGPGGGGGTIMVPITPHITVILTQPMMYTRDPLVVSTVLEPKEVFQLNYIVQIYSKKYIFYKSERPHIKDEFRREEHLELSDYPDSVEKFIRTIPGIRSSSFGLTVSRF